MSRSLCEWCASPRVFCYCEQDLLWCPQPVYHSRSVPAWSQTVWQCTPATNAQILNSLYSYTHKGCSGQRVSLLHSTSSSPRKNPLNDLHVWRGFVQCLVLAGSLRVKIPPWLQCPRLCYRKKALLQATSSTESIIKPMISDLAQGSRYNQDIKIKKEHF